MINWKMGRQGTGYSKLTLISSNRFDTHILKYEVGNFIPPHIDKLDTGKKHYRMNILLSGEDSFECQRVIFKWWRIVLFRPDLYEHSVQPVKRKRFVLSIGFSI